MSVTQQLSMLRQNGRPFNVPSNFRQVHRTRKQLILRPIRCFLTNVSFLPVIHDGISERSHAWGGALDVAFKRLVCRAASLEKKLMRFSALDYVVNLCSERCDKAQQLCGGVVGWRRRQCRKQSSYLVV